MSPRNNVAGSAPKDHPEYLIAKRENRLILNLVDVKDRATIAKEIMDEALQFINQNLAKITYEQVHFNEIGVDYSWVKSAAEV